MRSACLPPSPAASTPPARSDPFAAEGERAGLEVHQEAGTDRLADLGNKDPVFDVCFTDPRLLAGVAPVLGEFKLSRLGPAVRFILDV